ncbi:hypothetical protein AJ79_07661 [Helicocarpus griseus UAMH5409]|uniref:Uncharacterized protein n=1 Tax=Helicocarpus griseus UAMH5409 TaxID=1447875 RepID=A0A2B7X0S4_9EURO|nr:hypothetical protein AJ79_07661 [Helicocarpus griseus UAMH5409]
MSSTQPAACETQQPREYVFVDANGRVKQDFQLFPTPEPPPGKELAVDEEERDRAQDRSEPASSSSVDEDSPPKAPRPRPLRTPELREWTPFGKKLASNGK